MFSQLAVGGDRSKSAPADDAGRLTRLTRLAALAAAAFGAPMAAISLCEGGRRWSVASSGVSAARVRQDPVLCLLVVGEPQEDPLLVADVRADARFERSTLVRGEEAIRSFAGVPVRDPGGRVIGAVCVFDPRVGCAAEGPVGCLRDVAALVEQELADRALTSAFRAALDRYRALLEHATDLHLVLDEARRVVLVSPSVERMLDVAADVEDLGGQLLAHVHPQDRPEVLGFLDRVEGGLTAQTATARLLDVHGRWRRYEFVGRNHLHDHGIAALIITGRDVTDRDAVIQQLTHLATHDHLTGLANRANLRAALKTTLARVARDGHIAAVCCIDLDRFKAVNDTWGHAAGDVVLRAAGQRIAAIVREGDTAARVGGDEFVVLLDPVASELDAEHVAARLRDAVEAIDLTAPLVTIGASIGVAICEPTDTIDSVLARADQALYRDKRRRTSPVDEPPAVPNGTPG